jgi:ribosome-associated protein
MSDRPIELDQFLKHQKLVGSGGEAKVAIQSGQVKVNDAVETRRGRKLQPGDRVEFAGKTLVHGRDEGRTPNDT